MAERHTLHKPWWVGFSKWFVPLFCAVTAACMTVLFLNGYIPLPASLDSFKWFIAIYNSLEGLASIITMAAASFSIAALSMFLTQTFTKAWIVCPKNEALFDEALRINDDLRDKLKAAQNSFQDDVLPGTVYRVERDSDSNHIRLVAAARIKPSANRDFEIIPANGPRRIPAP